MCIPHWTKQIHQPNSPNSSLRDRASQEGSEQLSTCHDVIDQQSCASLPAYPATRPCALSRLPLSEVASNLFTVFHADTSHGKPALASIRCTRQPGRHASLSPLACFCSM